MINYYVDPGSGFVFVQNTALLWGIILGMLGGVFFLFKLFFKILKKFLWIVFIILAILIIGGLIMHKTTNKTKVIILGIDAMDPGITETLIAQGRLPNLSSLKTKGSYAHLVTSLPSESAVAWTSFATGLNPASHGIFDFIMRNPDTYLPYLSLSEISNTRGKIKITTRRKGDTLWEILSKRRIPCSVYFCPNTFPPERIFGRMLSGMGVPDITGTMGRFSFYTTKALTDEDADSRGRIVRVEPDNGVIKTHLYGPKVYSQRVPMETNIPLKIVINPQEKKIVIHCQRNHLSLKEGSWSFWQRVSFRVGLFKKACGIVKFYLKSIEPEFELYSSPINFNPESPPFAISYPFDYSKKLAKKVGLYYTQGMPHDTWMLTEGRLDEKAFLEQADEILNEKSKILREELKQFKDGLFFFYFDTLDMVQHMFWRYLDPGHPLFEADSRYKETIFSYYEKIDKIIGEILGSLDEDTTLIVLSDHGFSSFRWAVHLNRWLLENGYLFLKQGETESREFFENIDWSKTKAYALGFGGIYLNKIGREYYGILDASEAQNVKQKIIKELKNLRSPITQETVVNNIYDTQEAYSGPCLKDAPDLFVGFNEGFRASWQTALGGQSNVIIDENKRKWSGDHLIDPVLVKGILFINKKIDLKDVSILDIVPSVLQLFGVDRHDNLYSKGFLKSQR